MPGESDVAEMFVVGLPGDWPTPCFYVTDSRSQFEAIDPELPEIHKEDLKAHFSVFDTLGAVLEHVRAKSARIVAEKWGYC